MSINEYIKPTVVALGVMTLPLIGAMALANHKYEATVESIFSQPVEIQNKISSLDNTLRGETSIDFSSDSGLESANMERGIDTMKYTFFGFGLIGLGLVICDSAKSYDKKTFEY